MKIQLLIATLFLATTLSAQSINNYSMHFDGTDDEVIVTDTSTLQFTHTMTFEAWVKPTDLSGGGQSILANKEGDYEFGITPNGKLAYAIANTSPGWSWQTTTATAPLYTWTHFAITFDTNQILIYENGVMVDSSLASGIISNVSQTSNDLSIGWRTANFDKHLKGYMDEVRFWNVARKPWEIAANWNTELTGTESNLVLYYKFDEQNSVCDVEDCSLSKSHGYRDGISGNNNLPQYSDSTVTITDVACGTGFCATTSTEKKNLTDIDVWFANNLLYIENEKHQLLQIHFINTFGQVVHSTTATNDNNVVSFEHLPKGIYFVLLQNEEKRQTYKVVKF